VTTGARPAERPELRERLTATAGDPPEHHVRVALDTRLRALLEHEPGTRSGEDAEDLHQMRVAVRRMRAVLRAARPMLDRTWADGLRGELGWLGRALGPVRDLDVLMARLRGEADALGGQDAAAVAPLFDTLAQERAAARAAMLDAMGSERYAALLWRLADAVAEPLPAPTTGGPRPELATLVAKEFRRLRDAVREAGDDPADGVLHALRIHGKRLRYTAELAEPAIGRPARELIKATVTMQDVLGEHQDACVAQQRVRALVRGLNGLDSGDGPDGPDGPDGLDGLDGAGDAAGSRMALAAGRLVAREEVCRTDTRAAWPAAWRAVEAAAERALNGRGAVRG
jgi:CHAD domain-containing protein